NAANIIGGYRASLRSDLAFGARIVRSALLGALVGHAVLRADAAQPKRLVRLAEIAIGGVEVMIGFFESRLHLRLPRRQALLDRGEVGDREFHFDLEHRSSHPPVLAP